MILVTGGAGYIGSFMVRTLCDRGESVVVLDDLSSGSREALDPRATFELADLCDPAQLEPILKKYPFETIYHFAGKIRVEESVRLPELYHRVNTRGTRDLFEAAKRHCPKLQVFVFSSTASVYGDARTTPITEDSPTVPINPYGESKLNAENELKKLSEGTDIRLVILRYFNVAGASKDLRLGQRDRDATHLIKIACQVALGQRPELNVYGSDYPTRDGSPERDFIHVEDLVDIHAHASKWIMNQEQKTLTMNCGYGRPYSVLDIAREIGEIAGRTLPLRKAPRRPGDPASVYADISRLQGQLGWKPSHDSVREICRSALRWESALAERDSK